MEPHVQVLLQFLMWPLKILGNIIVLRGPERKQHNLERHICFWQVKCTYACCYYTLRHHYLDPPLQPVVSVASIINLTHNNFNLTMKCIPHNYHLHYAYTWIKKDDVLPSRARGVNSPHLTIVNLSPKDSGSYQCIVSNRTGRIASKISTVKIIGKERLS